MVGTPHDSADDERQGPPRVTIHAATLDSAVDTVNAFATHGIRVRVADAAALPLDPEMDRLVTLANADRSLVLPDVPLRNVCALVQEHRERHGQLQIVDDTQDRLSQQANGEGEE